MKRNSGFTLIELLVVIAIIGLIATVILGSLNIARMNSRDARRKTDLREMQVAFEFYFDQCGYYPRCGVVGPGCVNAGGDTICSTASYRGDLTINPVTPNILPFIPKDPSNQVGVYGYYYARGYKKVTASTYQLTGLDTDYVLATHLENTPNPALNGGAGNWNNNTVNYLVGN